MEASLIWVLANESGFLQQVGLNIRAGNITRVVEVDANEFSLKSTIPSN